MWGRLGQCARRTNAFYYILADDHSPGYLGPWSHLVSPLWQNHALWSSQAADIREPDVGPLYEIDAELFLNGTWTHQAASDSHWHLRMTWGYIYRVCMNFTERDEVKEREDSWQGRMVKFNLEILDIFTRDFSGQISAVSWEFSSFPKGRFDWTAHRPSAYVPWWFPQGLAHLGKSLGWVQLPRWSSHHLQCPLQIRLF